MTGSQIALVVLFFGLYMGFWAVMGYLVLRQIDRIRGKR